MNREPCLSMCFQCTGQILFGSIFACDTSEYNEVSYSVSAESVSAVYAACHFTGCEQTGNDIAFCIDDFSICIDLDTAHAVVDAW